METENAGIVGVEEWLSINSKRILETESPQTLLINSEVIKHCKGFMVGPVAVLDGNPIEAYTRKASKISEVLEYVKNNDVYLYIMISDQHSNDIYIRSFAK